MANQFNINHLKNKVYYSQNREDLLLEGYFPTIKDGFYVDVGAYDPDYDSVTKLFYLKGWSGINIEPQPHNFAQFEKRRKRDTNLHCGVAGKSSTMRLRSYENGGLSTFSPTMKQEYEHTLSDDTAEYEDINVPVHTLKKILSDHASDKQIHFMKIDVEGLEYDVIRSNDWEKFRPMVLCIEANHVEHDWRPLLAKADYALSFFDGLNEYYVDSRNKEITMDYVDHIITVRGGGISFADYQNVKLETERLNRCISERDQLMRTSVAEKAHLQAELNQQQQLLNSPKILLRRFIRLTACKIVKR